MVFAALTMMALAADAALRVPDGTKLRPVTQCFAIVQDGKVIGSAYQQIRATQAAGAPSWDIVVHQKVGANFDLRDHFLLAKRDLEPIAFDNRKSGKEHVRLTYAPGRITGARVGKDAPAVVNLAAPGPVWEGNLWGVTFGALPLVAGGSYSLPFYQYDQGFGTFTLKVTGQESVATPSGPVPAWAVDVTADGRRHITYLIGQRDGTELGSRAPGFETRLGGDCTGLD